VTENSQHGLTPGQSYLLWPTWLPSLIKLLDLWVRGEWRKFTFNFIKVFSNVWENVLVS